MRRIPRKVSLALVVALILAVTLGCERESRPVAGKLPMPGAPEGNPSPQVATVSRPAHIERIAAGGPEVVDGSAVYARVCAACHQAAGQGIPGVFPPLDGSRFVTGDPQRLLAIMIYGLQGEISVKGQTYNNVMAPLGAQLSDEELAAAATFVRTSWSNKAEAVEAAQIAAVREKWGSRGLLQASEIGTE